MEIFFTQRYIFNFTFHQTKICIVCQFPRPSILETSRDGRKFGFLKTHCQRKSFYYEIESDKNWRGREVKQVQPMWLWIFLREQFRETFEKPTMEKGQTNAISVITHLLRQAIWGNTWKTQWRKVKQMQPVWICILLCKLFEETFENTRWRKVKQMQTVWLCILSGKPFEKTFENT